MPRNNQTRSLQDLHFQNRGRKTNSITLGLSRLFANYLLDGFTNLRELVLHGIRSEDLATIFQACPILEVLQTFSLYEIVTNASLVITDFPNHFGAKILQCNLQHAWFSPSFVLQLMQLPILKKFGFKKQILFTVLMHESEGEEDCDEEEDCWSHVRTVREERGLVERVILLQEPQVNIDEDEG